MDDIHERIEVWLKENTFVFDKVNSLIIKNITFSLKRYNGTFDAIINDELIERYKFGCGDGTGTISAHPPLYHSPLGVPCSYEVVRIPTEVNKLIDKHLSVLFPKIQPTGLNKKTGKIITMLTLISDRILDSKTLSKSIETIKNENFFIKII